MNSEIKASLSAGHREHTFNSKTQFDGSEQIISSGTDILIGETNKYYKLLQMHKSVTKERKENEPRNGGGSCNVGVGRKTAFMTDRQTLIASALHSLVR